MWRYTLRQNRRTSRGTNLSLIALSSLALPPSRSRARRSCARGIKYNKDIQWELIGYLPIYRSVSAHCCAVTPRSVRDGLSLSLVFSVPLFCLLFVGLFSRRTNEDISPRNNIAFFTGSQRSAAISLRIASQRARCFLFGTRLGA